MISLILRDKGGIVLKNISEVHYINKGDVSVKKFEVPFNSELTKRIYNFIGETFGFEEADVEKPTISGEENFYNQDTQHIAMDGENLLGTAHLTISRMNPIVGGISGVAVNPIARGRGIGGMLISDCVKEFENAGGEALFLGTGNPVAARLYHSAGFSFIPGSNVMVWVKNGGSFSSFTSKYFSLSENKLKIAELTPGFRYPVVPLILYRGGNLVLDCNAGLWDCSEINQSSCAGLYEKYANILKQGGKVAGLTSDNGFIYAMATVLPTEQGKRMDFFACPDAANNIECLIEWCESQGADYSMISVGDRNKKKILESLGYRKIKTEKYYRGLLSVECEIMIK